MKQNRQPLGKSIYDFGPWRLTVLTSMLFRLEYDTTMLFEDRMSQIVVNRNFHEVACAVLPMGEKICISTEHATLWLDQNCFQFSAKAPCSGEIWQYGETLHNFGGTARTLDNADGAITLEDGIFSEEGIGILEDHSCLLDSTGEIYPRTSGAKDLYLFLYGRKFVQGLQDFYRLCGATPLLPRYTLGNWWSRYWPYTHQEYIDLMERFDREGIPISVAVLDMDWHITNVPEGYSGWTGYSWNRELIPEPEEFLNQLHRLGKRITLNLHPADGVQPFEDRYVDMAKTMGLDSNDNQTIPFDFVNKNFRKGYFDNLLEPLEQEGVDFWWIDWQQGTQSRIPGLDPLWLLNHYHFQHALKKNKHPVILSRYAGPGSHRYPIGFSGDTIVSWESLQFQPYFTATAANIGYGWWSHDIGGHMNGVKDDELACRWVQFGVFSPINRLHSTCNRFAGKEPWRYRQDIGNIMCRFLRLRNQLIPYLHAMNYRCHDEGIPLIRPMYHGWPEEDEAYRCPNQYEFGSQMIVAPVITPCDQKLGIAETNVWLPDGTYYDFFTGVGYNGRRWVRTYRTLSSIPAFVKAGGIIPVNQNNLQVTLLIFPGEDGSFTLFEDEQGGDDLVKTEIRLSWEEKRVAIASSAAQSDKVKPKEYTVCFCGLDIKEVAITTGEKKSLLKCSYDPRMRGSVITLPLFDKEMECSISFFGFESCQKNLRKEEILALIQQAQIEINQKEKVYSSLERSDFQQLPDIEDNLPEFFRQAIVELTNPMGNVGFTDE